jgi:hypothetical protein
MVGVESEDQVMVTELLVKKVLEIVDAGFTKGLGNPEAGQLCVEAAVCLAVGEEHNARPSCIGAAVRDYLVILNDADGWGTNAERARGLRRLAVAQLGSNTVDQKCFAESIVLKGVNSLYPPLVSIFKKSEQGCINKYGENYVGKLLREADRRYGRDCIVPLWEIVLICENAYVKHGQTYIEKICEEAYDVKTAYMAASVARLGCEETKHFNFSGVREAARRLLDKGDITQDQAPRVAAGHMARAFVEASKILRQKALALGAQVGVEALQHCGSPGCQWLHLVND